MKALNLNRLNIGIYHICENSGHDLGNPKFFDYLCTKLYL